MPSKNSIKDYRAQSFYHIYNRGAGGQKIFLTENDYNVFLSYFKIAITPEKDLSSKDTEYIQSKNAQRKLRLLDLSSEVELIAFCLLPNHFHLLIYQHNERGIEKLMRSIMTAYVMYFNRTYSNSGRLFQGSYKASLIDSDPYLMHITRYIHLNSIDVGLDVGDYEHSSYQYYLGSKKAAWVKPDRVLGMYRDASDYSKFVNSYKDTKSSIDTLKKELKINLEI